MSRAVLLSALPSLSTEVLTSTGYEIRRKSLIPLLCNRISSVKRATWEHREIQTFMLLFPPIPLQWLVPTTVPRTRVTKWQETTSSLPSRTLDFPGTASLTTTAEGCLGGDPAGPGASWTATGAQQTDSEVSSSAEHSWPLPGLGERQGTRATVKLTCPCQTVRLAVKILLVVDKQLQI